MMFTFKIDNHDDTYTDFYFVKKRIYFVKVNK